MDQAHEGQGTPTSQSPSGRSVAALILGILSLILPCIGLILGTIRFGPR
jgi:hypothetical protein